MSDFWDRIRKNIKEKKASNNPSTKKVRESETLKKKMVRDMLYQSIGKPQMTLDGVVTPLQSGQNIIDDVNENRRTSLEGKTVDEILAMANTKRQGQDNTDLVYAKAKKLAEETQAQNRLKEISSKELDTREREYSQFLRDPDRDQSVPITEQDKAAILGYVPWLDESPLIQTMKRVENKIKQDYVKQLFFKENAILPGDIEQKIAENPNLDELKAGEEILNERREASKESIPGLTEVYKDISQNKPKDALEKILKGGWLRTRALGQGFADIPAGIVKAVTFLADPRMNLTYRAIDYGADKLTGLLGLKGRNTDLERKYTQYLDKSREVINKYVTEIGPDMEKYKPDYLTQLSQGAGSVIGFMLTTALTRGMNLEPEIATGLLGLLTQAGSMADDTYRKTGDFDKAYMSFLAGIPLGYSERWGLGGMLGNLDKLTEGSLKKVVIEGLKEGAEETVQEGFQSWGEAYSDNIINDAGRDPLKEALDGISVAAPLGFIFPFGTAGVSKIYQKLKGSNRQMQIPTGEMSNVKRETENQNQDQKPGQVMPDAKVEDLTPEDIQGLNDAMDELGISANTKEQIPKSKEKQDKNKNQNQKPSTAESTEGKPEEVSLPTEQGDKVEKPVKSPAKGKKDKGISGEVVTKTENDGVVKVDSKGTDIRGEHKKIKLRYPETVVLMLQGDGYVTFDEDAKKVDKILQTGITHAEGSDYSYTSTMFAVSDIEANLPKLIKKGLKVAIADPKTKISEEAGVKAQEPVQPEDTKEITEKTGVKKEEEPDAVQGVLDKYGWKTEFADRQYKIYNANGKHVANARVTKTLAGRVTRSEVTDVNGKKLMTGSSIPKMVETVVKEYFYAKEKEKPNGTATGAKAPSQNVEFTAAEQDELDQVEAFPEKTEADIRKKLSFYEKFLTDDYLEGVKKYGQKELDKHIKNYQPKVDFLRAKLEALAQPMQSKEKQDNKPSGNKVKQTDAFGEVKISDITKKLKDYQGRQGEEYSEQTFNRIVNDVKAGTLVFDALPPIQVYERKNGDLELLAGHSRLAAFEYLNKEGIEYKGKDFSSIRSQIIRESDGVTYEQAKKIAQESNQGAVQKPTDNAVYLRGLREKGEIGNDAEQKQRAEDLYGKSGAQYVIDLSYLNPKGKTFQMLKSLGKSSDKDYQRRIESIASWIGAARKKFDDMLSDKHENEMFDWLMDENNFNLAGNKTKFIQRVQDVVDKPEFDPRKPLNLPKRESLSAPELEYRRKVSELEADIREQEKLLKDKRAEYVKRKQSDSSITNVDINRVLEPIRVNILDLQDRLEKLKQQEGKYKKAGEAEVGLFGNVPEKEQVTAAVTDEKMNKVRDDIADLEEEIRKSMGDKLVSGYDPKLALLTGKLISKYIQLGYYKIEQVARQMVAAGMEKLLPYLKEAYNKLRQDDNLSASIKNELSDETEVRGFDTEGFAEKLSEAERESILGDRELSAADRAKSGDRRPALRYANDQNLPDVKREYAVKGKYDIDEHQRYAVNLALQRFKEYGRAFLLADGPGVGKTREQLVIANEYRKVVKTGESLPILIITESDRVIKDSFTKDAAALNIGLSDFEIGTYGDLRDGKVGKQEKYGLVIYDEAHNLKNAETGKALASKNIKANNVLYATATPMDKPASALYFIGEIADAGEGEVAQLLGLKLEAQDDLFGGKGGQVVTLLNGVTEADVIKKIIDLRNKAISKGAMIRREYPFFGTVKNNEYRMPDADFERQNNIFDHYKKKITSVARSRDLSEKQKKEIMKKLGQKRASELHRLTESLKADMVYGDALKEIKAGKQVILAAEYVNDSEITSIGYTVESSISQLKRKLEKDGVKFAELYGGDKVKNRKAMIRFQTGQVQVLLMTYKSGGVGINLDDVEGDKPRVMFVLSPSHGGDMFQQVIGRVSRRNTQSPADVRLVYFEDSFNDNRRREIINNKMRTLNAIQEGADVDSYTEAADEMTYDVIIASPGSVWKNRFTGTKYRVKSNDTKFVVTEGLQGERGGTFKVEQFMSEFMRDGEDVRFMKDTERETSNVKRQTESEAFKKWFGDSKMVDENGKPIIAYHGTNRDFTVFRDDAGRAHDLGYYGRGFYFTFSVGPYSGHSMGEASYYGKTVMPVYLKIEKPFDFSKLSEYKGKGINYIGAESIVFLSNIAKHFPELADKIKIEKRTFVSDGNMGGHYDIEELPISVLPGLLDKYSKELKTFEFDGNDGRRYVSGYIKEEVVEYDRTDRGGTKGSYVRREDFGRIDIRKDANGNTYPSKEEIEILLLEDALEKYEGIKADLYPEGYMTRNPEITEAIKKQGYDGIVQSMYGDEAVVFSPNQIKSATMNTGAFDAGNPDIRFMKDRGGKDPLPGSAGTPPKNRGRADVGGLYVRKNKTISDKVFENNLDIRFKKDDEGYGNLFVVEKALKDEMTRLQRRLQNVDFELGTDSVYYKTEKRLGEIRQELIKVRAEIAKLKPKKTDFGEDQMSLFNKDRQKAEVKRQKEKQLYNAEIVKAAVGRLSKAIPGAEITYTDNAGMLELQKKYGNNDAVPHIAFALPGTSKIYINLDKANAEAPIHEFGHLFGAMIRAEKPGLWDDGKKIIRTAPQDLMDYVKAGYPGLTEDQLLDEVLMQAVGSDGKILWDEQNKTLYNRFKAWLERFWNRVQTLLTGKLPKMNIEKLDLRTATFKDLSQAIAKDLLSGNRVVFEKEVEDAYSDLGLVNAELAADKSAAYAKNPMGVNSPEFKAWFGKSKIVDKNGKPLVVYHGTLKTEPFTEFAGGDFDYFTDNPKYTTHFSGSKDVLEYYPQARPKTYPVYLKIEKPLDLRDYGVENLSANDLREILKEKGALSGELDEILRDNEEYEGDFIPVWSWIRARIDRKLKNSLKENGFDGVIIKERFTKKSKQIVDAYLTIEPTQIKSATGNIGTFDPNNPDIRYERGEYADVFYSQLERVAESKVSNNATPEQVMNTLLNNGVKKEEIEWMGLEEAIRNYELGITNKETGKISKKALMDFIAQNKVVIEEKVLDKKWLGIEIDRDEVANLMILDKAELDDGIKVKRVDEDEYEIFHYGEYQTTVGDVDNVVDYVRNNIGKGIKDSTKYSNYQLPGGENYREILFKLPNQSEIDVKKLMTAEKLDDGTWQVSLGDRFIGNSVFADSAESAINKVSIDSNLTRRINNVKENFISSHYPDPNILAHTRVNDRTISNEQLAMSNKKQKPGRMLFIEEIQSDWHQGGRKHGYRKTVKEFPATWQVKETDGKFQVKLDNGDLAPYGKTIEEAKQKAIEFYNSNATQYDDNMVPDAPFKKTWHEFVIKRMIRYAAENGYDSVGWTTGEQQNERYDLRKHVKEIAYSVSGEKGNEDYNILIQPLDSNRGLLNIGEFKANELPDKVGKEVAEKIVNGEYTMYHNGLKAISGLDLKIGGEGMKGFYDKMLPSFVNKYAKKWGGKVTNAKLQSSNAKMYDGFEDAMEAFSAGETVWIKEEESGKYFNAADPSDIEFADEWYKEKPGEEATIHKLDITPEMANSVLYGGQALFQKAKSKEQITDTEAFKKWFRDSKVVDSDGKPLVVYHGTITDFNEFGTGMFTANPKIASNYAAIQAKSIGRSEGQQVYPVYLKIENPYILNKKNLTEIAKELGYGTSKSEIEGFIEDYRDSNSLYRGMVERYIENSHDYDGYVILDDLMPLKTKKYDYVRTKSYVVFSSNQIKSATGNSGAFDAGNPDIRFMKDRGPEDKTPRQARGEGPSGLYVRKNKTISDKVFNNNLDKLGKIGAKILIDEKTKTPRGTESNNKEQISNTKKDFKKQVNDLFSNEGNKKPFVLTEDQADKLYEAAVRLVNKLERDKMNKEREFQKRTEKTIGARISRADEKATGVVNKILNWVQLKPVEDLYTRAIGKPLFDKSSEFLLSNKYMAKFFEQFADVPDRETFKKLWKEMEGQTREYKELAKDIANSLYFRDFKTKAAYTLVEQRLMETMIRGNMPADNKVTILPNEKNGLKEPLVIDMRDLKDRVRRVRELFNEMKKLGELYEVLPIETYNSKLPRKRVAWLLKFKAELEMLKQVADSSGSQGMPPTGAKALSAEWMDAKGNISILKFRNAAEIQERIDSTDKMIKNNYKKGGEGYFKRVYVSKELEKTLSKYGIIKPTKLDLTSAIHRKDIPLDVRVKMGEVLTAAYPTAKSIVLEGKDVSIGRFFEAISENSVWSSHQPVEGWEKVPDNKKYGKLRNMHVHPEVWTVLNDVIKFSDPGYADSFIKELTSIWKAVKVPMNPPTISRNLMNNFIMLDYAGTSWNESFTHLPKAIKEMRNYAKNGKNSGNGDFAHVVSEFKSTSFSAQEMLKFLDDYEKLGIDKPGFMDMSLADKILHVVKKATFVDTPVGRAALSFYQGSEVAFKMVKFLDSKAKGKTDEEAINEANKWLFDYSDIPSWVKRYRENLFGMPFITWSYKAFPRVIEAAVTRPISFGKYPALFYWITSAAIQALGLTDDDWEQIKKDMPDRMKNGQWLLIPYRNSKGQIQMLDLTFIMPYSDIYTMGLTAYTLVTEGTFPTGATVAEGMGNMLGNPVMSMSIELSTNYNRYTRREIWGSADTPAEKYQKMADYIYKMWMPSWSPETNILFRAGMGPGSTLIPDNPWLNLSRGGYVWDKLRSAITDRPDYYGRLFDLGPAIGSSLFGLKTTPIDPDKLVDDNIKQREGQILDLLQKKGQVIKDDSIPMEQRLKQAGEIDTKVDALKKEIQEYEKRAEPDTPEALLLDRYIKSLQKKVGEKPELQTEINKLKIDLDILKQEKYNKDQPGLQDIKKRVMTGLNYEKMIPVFKSELEKELDKNETSPDKIEKTRDLLKFLQGNENIPQKNRAEFKGMYDNFDSIIALKKDVNRINQVLKESGVVTESGKEYNYQPSEPERFNYKADLERAIALLEGGYIPSVSYKDDKGKIKRKERHKVQGMLKNIDDDYKKGKITEDERKARKDSVRTALKRLKEMK